MKASKQRVLGIALAGLVVHFLAVAALGQDGEPNTPQSAGRTGCYVFLTEQSTTVQTGGFAGVHRTYALEGRFCLILDPDAGAAHFERIDAGAVEAEEPAQTLDPNETFNLTNLTGTIIDETTVEFTGQAADGSDVSLTVIFDEDAVCLTGQTTPPPDSADFFLFSIDAVATRKYAGGTGDPDAPYQIATAADLITLGETPEDYGQHFILTADIDLDPNLPGGRIFDRALIAPHHGDMEWSLLAPEFQGTAFSGILEGNGCIVANLTVDGGTGAYLALFGSVSGSAAIRGVALEHAVVTGREYVAGLVGYNEGTVSDCQVTCCLQGEGFAPWRFGGLAAFNAGYIDNCRVTGAIWGLDSSGYFAGLIGWNEGTITDSRASVDITGGAGCWEVGGLVGDNRGPVTNCHATGNVTGGDRCKFLGGLVGMNYYTTLTNCSAGGHISAGVRSDRVAGLVGGNLNGTIVGSCATGDVTADADCFSLGGLAGDHYGAVIDCWSLGEVSSGAGGSSVAGLIGASWGSVANCHTAGAVSVGTGTEHFGALIGIGSGDVNDSFWDEQTSGVIGSAGGQGRTTNEMQTAATFLEAGWDFAGETENGTEDLWWIDEGQDYPRLWWEAADAEF